jgi:molecular chaperone DnaJ
MPANTAKRDYYEVLGLDRSATQEQIKQAYRQLAMRWHPDRNPAPDAADSFKEIAEAYAVLSDDTKRQAYDTTGHAGVNQRWSTEDIFHDFNFGDFFGGHSEDLGSLFGNLFGGRAGQTTIKPHGADLRCELKLTLEQAAAGGEHLIHITKQEHCKTCGGNGAKPGTKPQTCAECKGSGEKQQARKDKTMNVVKIFTCSRCNGTGRIIEQLCASCQGAGSEFLPHVIKVQVPAGVDHGMLLRLAGQGQAGPGSAPPGDLLVRIYLQPHPHLKRDDDDLYTTITCSFPDAALGGKIVVPCLGGEKLQVTLPAGTQSGTALRMRGKGMPRMQGKGKGDFFVTVEVRTPTNLTPRQRQLLKEYKLEAEQPQKTAAS